MQNEDADQMFAELGQKILSGKILNKEDLVPLTLCPLMGGRMSQKERIKAAFSITRKAVSIDADIIRKIEAVVYTMADKFLDSIDMEEVMEEIKMTKLGQMLVDKGREEGRQEGREETLDRINSLNRRLLLEGREAELRRTLMDPEYQKELLKEYRL